MPRRTVVAFLFAFPAVSTAQAPTSVAADPAPRVDSVFARWNTTTSPGCAVGVSRNGVRALERGYGMANLEYDVPNSAQTVFEAGSVSKQFTATGLILLAQRGRLSLDDDVRKYVPELPEYGRTITLRHLLSHTSGLRDWGSVAEIAGWPRTTRVHTHAHVLDILSRQKSLNYPVGDEYSYTNSGYNLAAMIIARVSGMSFADFERKEIFEPLGLTNTQWRDDYTRIVKNRATAYERSGASYRKTCRSRTCLGTAASSRRSATC
jgi:CubicO group peptidase (beta-lactamase class C family)